MEAANDTVDHISYTGHVCTCPYINLVRDGLLAWRCRGCGIQHHSLYVVKCGKTEEETTA